MSEEDKRQAVNLYANLSGQLMGASLAMIAVLAAIATFLLGKSDELPLSFYLFSVLSFSFFVTSIVFGGMGVNKSAEEGFEGKWSLKTGSKNFNWQAGYAFAGLIFLILMILSRGREKEDPLTTFLNSEKQLHAKTDSLSNELLRIQRRIDNCSSKTPQKNRVEKHDSKNN